jgi:hypothetical protein
MAMQHLEDAHQAICHAAVTLDRDILQWDDPAEIIPVPQYYFGEDLMLWVSEKFRDQLNAAWHQNRKRVNAWKA